MRNTNRIALATGVLAASSAVAVANPINTMVCDIRGGQVNPPTGSDGFGVGRFVVNTSANTVQYHIAFTGLSAPETVAHIHGPADIGANAGVKHNLGLGNPKVGVWTYAEADEADILAGKMYVNIHSGAFPGGEIRGQIVDMISPIDGPQEVPASGSANTAWGAYDIDTVANTLTYHIQIDQPFAGTETAAHIHGAAMHGANAGVLFSLGVGNVKTGVWNYPENVENAILNGQTYVNIHSTAFPGGEIRGQITRMAAPLDSQQEVPAVTDPDAAGAALIAVNYDSNNLSYYLRHANLSGAQTAAHIHGMAPAGANAGVLHNIGVGTPIRGTFNFAEAQQDDIVSGLTYINVHSAMFPGGNIRGQVFVEGDVLPPACPGDVNFDGVVNFADLAALLSAWGPQPCSSADVDGDENVGSSDLAVLLGAWGPCP